MTLDYLLITVAVIAVACFGKIIGAYLGARFIGHKDHWTALGFGAALNARGAMEIIVATIGLSAGILSQEMFSIIVIMALATSLMAPSLLQVILKHLEPVDEELKRLEEEELLHESPIARMHRILLPMREPQNEQLTDWQILRFKILEKIANKRKMSLTILHVNPLVSERSDNQKTLNLINNNHLNLQPTIKIAKAKSSETSSAILDEAEKGYDLMILGSNHQEQSMDFISPIISDVVQMSPCPTILMYANNPKPNWQAHNILVAVSNSTATKHAAELGFIIAGESNPVTLLSVITGANFVQSENAYQYATDRQTEVAVNAINTIKQLAQVYNIPINDLIEVGDDVESTILKVAETEKSNLIILGTNIKSGSERLFFGPKIEYVIQHAKCPVIILNI